MRAFRTDSTEEQGATDPQRKGSEYADEPFEEEIPDDAIAVTVGLKPRVDHGQHAKQERQPVKPALGFGRLGRFANPLLDFEFDELTSPAPTKEEGQAKRCGSGENR